MVFVYCIQSLVKLPLIMIWRLSFQNTSCLIARSHHLSFDIESLDTSGVSLNECANRKVINDGQQTWIAVVGAIEYCYGSEIKYWRDIFIIYVRERICIRTDCLLLSLNVQRGIYVNSYLLCAMLFCTTGVYRDFLQGCNCICEAIVIVTLTSGLSWQAPL